MAHGIPAGRSRWAHCADTRALLREAACAQAQTGVFPSSWVNVCENLPKYECECVCKCE